MGERTIDVEKCEELANKLLQKIYADPDFALIVNYELEVILAFVISINAYAGAKIRGGK